MPSPHRPPAPQPSAPESRPRLERPIRAAVVGSGAIAREHLSFLSGRSPIQPAESVAGRIRLVGVCDLSEVSARHGASEFGADEWYTDLDVMLAKAKPDVVHVLTPPQSHQVLATSCLRAGSHVICEKPVTPTHPELLELVEVAQESGRHLMESQNYRFNRPVEVIRQAIDDGRLGPIGEVEIRVVLPATDPAGRFADPNLPNPIHHMPAGVIHDVITHMVYLPLHLAGPVQFERISAAWSNHANRPGFKFDDLDATLIGQTADGPLHVRLRFDARGAPDTFSIHVRGADGWAETDLFQPFVRIVRPRAGGGQLSPIVNHLAGGWHLLRAGFGNVGRKIMQQSPYEGLHHMLDLTYQALEAGRPLPVTIDDMVATSELIDRLLDEKVRL